jgi:hypothetical protein
MPVGNFCLEPQPAPVLRLPSALELGGEHRSRNRRAASVTSGSVAFVNGVELFVDGGMALRSGFLPTSRSERRLQWLRAARYPAA